ncbi:MAG TPA: flagellar biosynthesis protein FlhA [Ferrovibrio sp.]|uniref:flagellar biosynthesis protein FlhA n=1 Tax=Ferrovibrio sp. TaxID=1917215 RepID=UPI002B4B5A80|nr:flagellar biosynthesis protein FlhA [Ferrovibrio sp.]HLT76271.1 flagellar biosynthesis protein FlhA [Ferrovibrio sp.]
MAENAPAEMPATPLTGGGSVSSLFGRFRLGAHGDIMLAIGIMAILSVLILPMPTWMLDIALAVSITASVMVMMTCLFIQRPLEFSSFPTVLLITTMLRLALNLASTRLILGNGHEGTDAAGHVIEAFGQFVMSGNLVIGIIVFAILVIVNFVVITKGSGRIAEVSARFTLDAMPGKQMAIDADLSAGLIDEATARTRRKELEDESSFFGSMDGASKFVRGDAVAGLLITFINLIGGILIGVLQNDMTFAAAVGTYSILTVGDGLVSQIPALIISVAAGIMVSKGGVTGSTDKALSAQLSSVKGLGMSAVLALAFALIPGMPFMPFMVLAIVMGGLAYLAWEQEKKAAAAAFVPPPAPPAPVNPLDEPVTNALAIDDLRLELGFSLLPLINDARGYRLTDQIKALRRQIAIDMGFIMPSVRILDNMQLPGTTYVIRVKEVEAARGEVKPNMLLVMDPRGERIALQGQETIEPTFGLPAMWVDEALRDEAMFRGYTVVDPGTVITTHLTEVVKDNMPDLLSFAETQKLIEELKKTNDKLVMEVLPNRINVNGIQRVLQNLLAERVSIRDFATILEAIAEATGYTQSITQITEHVRSRLARQISNANVSPDGFIPLVTLSPQWEQNFAEALIGQGEERQLSMQPSKLQDFIAQVRQTFERLAGEGHMPVLLTSPTIRPYVRSIIERFRPATVVMSQQEIHPKAKLRTVGQI